MRDSGENISIEGIAYRIFGGYFTRRKANFDSLRDDLMKARLYVPVEKWLSKAVLYSVIVVSCVVIGYLMLKVIIFTSVLKRDLIFGLMDVVLISIGILISFCLTFFSFYLFPKIRAWERKGKIDRALPYAIGYVSSMASVGVIPYEIFKKLSEAEGTYGEVSIEAKQMVRDVKLLGFDFLTALKNLVALTPSMQMRAFLQGALTTALSGGEMGSYFIKISEEYMEERRLEYESFIETLGLYAEFYVVGLVVAPLLLVIVLSIMCFLGGASLESLAAIVYIVIPLSTAGFIVLIGLTSLD